jgi:hypothetical protein
LTIAANERQTFEGGTMSGLKGLRLLMLAAAGGVLCALGAIAPAAQAAGAAATATGALVSVGSPTPAQFGLRAAAAAPANVDISQRHLNESEEAIAVNPVNPDNIVTVTNVGHGEAGLAAGMFEGVSFDCGGP